MPEHERRLSIELLGGLRLFREGVAPQERPAQQPEALLALLALHLPRAVSREELTESLWPGEDPEAARHRLRNALHSLRRLLESPPLQAPEILVATRDTVQLAPERVRTDVAAFAAALQSAARSLRLALKA